MSISEMSLIIYLFMLGAIIGSFVSVLIYRNRYGGKITLTNRSKCPSCEKQLRFKNLIPIFSWLVQCGKCSNCKNKIPKFYPLLELFSGVFAIFAFYGLVSFFGLSFDWSYSYYITLTFILTLVSVYYIVYDFLYKEIPIRFITLIILGIILLTFFGYIPEKNYLLNFIVLYSLLAIGFVNIKGFFMKKEPIFVKNTKEGEVEKDEKIEKKDYIKLFSFGILIPLFLVILLKNSFALYYDSIILLMILGGFSLINIVTRFRGMGGGDLLLAIMIISLFGAKFTIYTLGLASILVCFVGIPIIINKYIFKGSANSQVAFGPFIGISTIILLYFSDFIF